MKEQNKWIITVFILTFILSVVFSSISNVVVTKFNNIVVSIIISAIISSFTVGGKAIFKIVAINNADNIIFTVGKVINKFNFKG